MIIHAQARWHQAVSTNLWPYAIRLANEIHNAMPGINNLNNITPLEAFHGSRKKPDLILFQPFACPTYVLDNRLQANQKIPKWEWRSRVGLYLGMSMQHARSVALVLNLTTGHVSPQFHVKFDPTFSTVDPRHGNILPEIKWKREAQFEKSHVAIERAKDTIMIKPLKDTNINKDQSKDIERQNSLMLHQICPLFIQ